MADPLTSALVRIADDDLRRNRDFAVALRDAGSPFRYEADVSTEAERISFGAFIVAHGWLHKLLDRQHGWMLYQTHDSVGVALSTALAILALERLHQDALAGEPNVKEFLNKAVAGLFRGFLIIWPEAKVRELSDAAFKLRDKICSSNETQAVEFRETFSKLLIVDTLNRYDSKVADSQVEFVLFGLYDNLRGAIEAQ